ncbi:hypothetical protein [Tannerella forsythia]|uniref:hypothetical protein n=1 Tax=Tannerella forsythia TaxID=28112 RepID=UPI000945B20F|nr:hypothetical protein [Tannerella forsythia]
MINGLFSGHKKNIQKTSKIFAYNQKLFIPLSYITKKDKTMEKTTDIPPDKPMRLANRTGGAA